MLGRLAASEVERLLQSESIARVGCHMDGRTYIVPIAYALDLLMARFVTQITGETTLPSHATTPSTHARAVSGQPSVVYRIRLTEKTGRFERSR